MNTPGVWSSASSYPKREGNSIDVYVDGQESFAAIAEATWDYGFSLRED